MTARALKAQTLNPVRPNAGDTAKYRRRLEALIKEMNDSVVFWTEATYKANAPEIAQDELPYAALQRVIRKLSKRWQKRFDEASKELAEYFTKRANQRSAQQLMQMLRDAGFSVKFKMTRAARDVMQASIAEQVGLIKSIPERYFTEVEGAVMRSVQQGRNLSTLTKDLQKNYGVTYRRAKTIASDQNNKMTATLTRVRQQEAGIKEAIWVHSGGGKEPRPNHLAAGQRKQRYDITKGMWDPDAEGKGKGKMIFPGELINCRCVSRPVVSGFS